MLKAAKLRPFRFARTRQETLEKAAEIHKATKRGIYSNPIPQEHVDLMGYLGKQGLSYGDIREYLYRKHGYTLDPGDIQRLISENKKKRGA